MKQKNIFITGGAGFIGSAIAKKLLEKGHKITIYDNFSSGAEKNIEEIISRVRIIKGDIQDYDHLKKSMLHHDMVIHQAAQLEITKAINNPEEDVKVNIMGSLNILKSMKENGIRKLIIASSACVYGNVEKYPAKEADVTHPNWEYGVSKLAVERYCDIYADYEGFDIASLRYSIVYGKNEWYGRVLTILIKRAIENNDLVIFGKGDGRRDLINVEDVAEFNALLADKEWRGHEIFNVSSGKAVSINELGKIVKDIHYSEAGKKIKVLHEDLEEGKFSHKVKGRMRLPRELKIMHLDNSKAKRFVPWKPTIKLKEGIKQEYHWLKRNPERWTNMSY